MCGPPHLVDDDQVHRQNQHQYAHHYGGQYKEPAGTQAGLQPLQGGPLLALNWPLALRCCANPHNGWCAGTEVHHPRHRDFRKQLHALQLHPAGLAGCRDPSAPCSRQDKVTHGTLHNPSLPLLLFGRRECPHDEDGCAPQPTSSWLPLCCHTKRRLPCVQLGRECSRCSLCSQLPGGKKSGVANRALLRPILPAVYSGSMLHLFKERRVSVLGRLACLYTQAHGKKTLPHDVHEEAKVRQVSVQSWQVPVLG